MNLKELKKKSLEELLTYLRRIDATRTCVLTVFESDPCSVYYGRREDQAWSRVGMPPLGGWKLVSFD